MRRLRCLSSTSAVLATLAFVWSSTATTFHVDDSNPSPGNGLSWPNCFNDLQDALDAARNDPTGAPHVIRVAQGMYKPTGGTDRTISFVLVDDTTVNGGYVGYNNANPDTRDPDEYVTILSGDIDTSGDDDSFHVVTAEDITEAILDGVPIGHGRADGTLVSAQRGAGIHVDNAALEI